VGVEKPMARTFGRIPFDTTTLGLGGQSSLQWTPSDVDPAAIIVKAFRLGVNYFDTSNLYGPSQMNYGKAFREMHLIPGRPGYDEPLRRSIFLTSKTRLRYAKGGEGRAVGNTQGAKGSRAIDDVRRTLTQVFGDGKGPYPPGAYVDMVLLHAMGNMRDVDAVYEGYEGPDPKAERIGAIAALIDYRDGTNLTGLNPEEERPIRHIGFSGHRTPAVLMELIQRDTRNVLDGMLVSINPNDRLYFNMQYNVIPVAAEKYMGIIAMKAFADGAMYTKEARWSRTPDDVVRTVGSPSLPSRPLVEYALTTPGIHTAIIGIGQIADDPQVCQLRQNLSASQIATSGLSESDRRDMEQLTRPVKDGKTNYFQRPAQPLTPPQAPTVAQEVRNGQRIVRVAWHTAFAGDEPIRHYEVLRDDKKVAQEAHRPQTTKEPFAVEDTLPGSGAHTYRIVATDAAGSSASTERLGVPAIG